MQNGKKSNSFFFWKCSIDKRNIHIYLRKLAQWWKSIFFYLIHEWRIDVDMMAERGIVERKEERNMEGEVRRNDERYEQNHTHAHTQTQIHPHKAHTHTHTL